MNDTTLVEKYDPRGLIRESYRMEGIDAGQCRSVFLDWVLGAAADPGIPQQIEAFLSFYASQQPDHPMSAVLREGLAGQATPKGRRGGWRSRQR